MFLSNARLSFYFSHSAQSANLTKAQMVTYLTNATVQQEFVNSLLDDFKCIRDELAKVIQDLINASPFNGKLPLHLNHFKLFCTIDFFSKYIQDLIGSAS